MVEFAYFLSILGLGFLHGLEPGHGWPIAALLAMNKKRPLLYGFFASNILSFAHMFSSLFLVMVYFLVRFFFEISLPYIKYIASFLLFLLGLKILLGKRKGETKREFITLKRFILFSLTLGFAHEEEIVLLGFTLQGLDPLLLMLLYSIALLLTIVGMTLISLQAYNKVRSRITIFEFYINKLSGLVIIVSAVFFLLNIR
ncbi:MAG: hypothetical protein QXX95_00405 [Nitrososphaerales archaeon]